MRILYVDIDSLRPDHLGCYGYHRNTSPNIDRVAAQGVRFHNLYVSDSPCLPSRTALWSGRFGIHNGVVNHGGAAAEMFNEGIGRGMQSTLGKTGWMQCLRRLGLKTATVSPFGERHSAWHWYANFNEIYNTGRGGMERADEIAPVALDWLPRHGGEADWFLHVNFWDPHTPYRTPSGFDNPFADDPTPAWLTEEVRRQHWQGVGPHSAQEPLGFEGGDLFGGAYPHQPFVMDSMTQVRRMFDGYDMGIRYADQSIGRLLNALSDLNVLDETVIIISADHGENLGELNVYGDHQTADGITPHVPLIVRWPGLTENPRVDKALHYHVDFAATLIELLGGRAPENWDGVSFADAFQNGVPRGREALILSQGAWSGQRAVRWEDYLCLRSYHDGYHGFPDVMLFDTVCDPHEQQDLAPEKPDLVGQGMALLDGWYGEMMRTATHGQDPLWTVLREGGAYHTRGCLPKYLRRLRETGRSEWAERLAAMHPREA